MPRWSLLSQLTLRRLIIEISSYSVYVVIPLEMAISTVTSGDLTVVSGENGDAEIGCVIGDNTFADKLSSATMDASLMPMAMMNDGLNQNLLRLVYSSSCRFKSISTCM